jgi:hypothetical protein
MAPRFVDESIGLTEKFVDKAVVATLAPSYGSSCPKGPTQTDRRGEGRPAQRRRSGRTSRKARPRRDRRSGGLPAAITSRLVASTIEPAWLVVPSGVFVCAESPPPFAHAGGASRIAGRVAEDRWEPPIAGFHDRDYTPAMGQIPIR